MHSTETAATLNHVFVDFENVQEVDADLIGTKGTRFTLLLGARQNRLEVGLVEILMRHAASVQLIRLASSGKNALDFALAYYVGRAVSCNPAACIHIISKDTGFDPLIEHLQSQHIQAHRHDSFATLKFPGMPGMLTIASKKVAAVQEPETLTLLCERLRKNVNSRPKKKKTLLSHLKSSLGKDATEKDAITLLKRLRAAGYVEIGEKDAVTYHV